MEAIAVATDAEARKKERYALLSKSHHFVPIAIETSGALGPDALSLLTDISRHQQSMTYDHQSLPFLLQRVSIALQHGNAASVLGTKSNMQFIQCFQIASFFNFAKRAKFLHPNDTLLSLKFDGACHCAMLVNIKPLITVNLSTDVSRMLLVMLSVYMG